MKKAFGTATIYSLASGHIATNMEKMYELAQHLIGHPVWTHELIAVHHACKEYLDSILPKISEFEWIGPNNLEGAKLTIDALTERYGSMAEVEEGVLSSALAGKSPLDSLAEMMMEGREE